jgi:hypothetical protein
VDCNIKWASYDLPGEENSGHGCAIVYGRQEAIGKESNEFPTVGKHDRPNSPIVREPRHRKFIPGVVYSLHIIYPGNMTLKSTIAS